jgi:hypothetical protein
MARKTSIIAGALILPLAAGAVLALRDRSERRRRRPRNGTPTTRDPGRRGRRPADRRHRRGHRKARGRRARRAARPGRRPARVGRVHRRRARPAGTAPSSSSTHVRSAPRCARARRPPPGEERLALAELEHRRGEKLFAADVIHRSELDRLGTATPRHALAPPRRAPRCAPPPSTWSTPTCARPSTGASPALVTRGNLVMGGAAATRSDHRLRRIHARRVRHRRADLRAPHRTGRARPPGHVALDGDRTSRARRASTTSPTTSRPGRGPPAAGILPNRDGKLRPVSFARIRLRAASRATRSSSGTRRSAPTRPALRAVASSAGVLAPGDRDRRHRRRPACRAERSRAGERIVVGGLARPGMTVTPSSLDGACDPGAVRP